MNRLTKNRLRILDALIAEHIFGWKWFSALGDAFLIPPHGQEECRHFSVHWTEGLVEKKWCDRKETSRQCKKRYDIEMHYRDYARWEIPHYSTVKEDAFSVMERLGRTQSIRFGKNPVKEIKGEWLIYSEKSGIFSTADSLQLAFVLFALEFKNIQIPWKFKQKPHAKSVSQVASAS